MPAGGGLGGWGAGSRIEGGEVGSVVEEGGGCRIVIGHSGVWRRQMGG